MLDLPLLPNFEVLEQDPYVIYRTGHPAASIVLTTPVGARPWRWIRHAIAARMLAFVLAAAEPAGAERMAGSDPPGRFRRNGEGYPVTR